MFLLLLMVSYNNNRHSDGTKPVHAHFTCTQSQHTKNSSMHVSIFVSRSCSVDMIVLFSYQAQTLFVDFGRLTKPPFQLIAWFACLPGNVANRQFPYSSHTVPIQCPLQFPLVNTTVPITLIIKKVGRLNPLFLISKIMGTVVFTNGNCNGHCMGTVWELYGNCLFATFLEGKQTKQ